MDIKKAIEIVASEQNLEVLYKNNPVWIEHIHEDKETADIVAPEFIENAEVPISELKATGREFIPLETNPEV